jgi:hypothetical protein
LVFWETGGGLAAADCPFKEGGGCLDAASGLNFPLFNHPLCFGIPFGKFQ